MSSPNKDKNALEVLADTASDDELRNRYDASKHSVRSSSENRDHYSTSSETKEDDDSGGRGSADGDLNSSIRKAASKAKKDGLRKGKWMEEEEEYTTRVIHHFSSGLITLPEGKTLRTFLADKLQCDPMRITKKFAGASCLSKKIHTLCERPQFTPQEIEAARIEIERLEERFKLRLEHGPGVVLPPMERKTPIPIGGSVTSPQYSNSYIPEAASVCSTTGSINPSQIMAPNTQASLALLAYNAQLAAASNPAAALPLGAAPHSNPAILQSAPAPPPAPATFANLGTSAPAPVFDLQALLQQINRTQPTNPPPETHPNLNSQQLTQSLVSQLLTQLQTLATVSPSTINQLHSQLFAAVSQPAISPPIQNPAAGMDIAGLLQHIQAASQAQTGNFAAANSGKQHYQMPQTVPNPTFPAGGQSNASVQSTSSQYSQHLAPQVQPQNPSNNMKPPNNTIADLLAQLKKGHDDALQKARRESKKRKKGKFKMHSCSSLTNGSSESENQKQLRYERATVVSSESGSRSKNPNDTEGSASSADLVLSDAAKGCDSSSSNSGSDDDRDSRKGPLRKRFKVSLSNGGMTGMTQRDLQDHDKRMARNAN